MKRKIFSVLLALVLALSFSLMTATPARAATFTITTNTNWSAIPSGPPLSTDTVTVKNGATLTVDVTNAVAATLNLGISGGASNGNGTLSFSAGTSVLSVGTSLVIGNGAKTGSINMASGGTLQLGGTITVTNGGTWTPGTGTVDYNAAGAQTVDASFFTSYNNLTLSGSGAKTTTGVTVNGTLSMQGTATASAAPTYGASAVLVYAGSSSQTTGPELTATIPNLTINNANGVTLNSSPTISGTLTLTSGKITTGSNTLIISSSGSVSGGGSSSYVIGNLQKYVATGATSRTFEVGEAADYDPVTLAFGNVTVAGNLTVKVTDGEHPNIASSRIKATKNVNDYWTLTNSGITFDSYSATFTFAAGDVDSGANTSAFIVGRYSGGWTYPTVGTRTATSTQATGLTSLSDFAIGDSWDSYNDAAHTVQDDLFDSSGNSIVYMFGQGFLASHNYAVGYYDGNLTGGGQKVATDSGLVSTSSGDLSSQYVLTTDFAAVAGTWHAAVFDSDVGAPLQNYNDVAAAAGFVIDDDFQATTAAIPEFPTVIAAIVVGGLCFGVYYWMRKRNLVYVRVKA